MSEKQASKNLNQGTTVENANANNGVTVNSIGPSETELINNIYPDANNGANDEDFQITRGEFEQLQEALKKKEFCKMLTNYVEEIRDPVNQLKFQSELRELENQRGNTVHFLNPVGGYVLKTSINGKKKCFINMCSNSLIKKPTFTTATQDKNVGKMWSIPHSPSIARDDIDKAGVSCCVYDVIFNPEALKLAKQNFNYKLKLEEAAIETIEKSFNVKLDKNNIRRPKQKYKGMKNATMIKYKTGEPLPDIIDAQQLDKETPPQKDVENAPKKGNRKNSPEKASTNSKPKLKETTNVKDPPTAKNDLKLDSQAAHKEPPNEKNDSKKPQQAGESETEWTEPHYSLKFRNHINIQDFCLDTQKSGRHVKPIPEEIILTVDLPLLRDASNLDADVLEGGWDFELESKGKILYKLHLKLPFQVDHTESKATFDKDTRKLTITMRTIPKPVESADPCNENPKISGIVARESSEDGSGDSGVELLETKTKPPKIEMLETDSNEEEGRHKKGIDVVRPRSALHKPVSLDSMGSAGSFDLSRSSSYETEDSAMTNFGSPSTKKTVRFSDEVKRQIYRSNSSILGQRKKNQRKAANKKKARERLNSGESVSSLSVDEDEDVFGIGGHGSGKIRERFNSGGSISSIDEELLAGHLENEHEHGDGVGGELREHGGRSAEAKVGAGDGHEY